MSAAAVDQAAVEETRRALGRALLLLARECAAAEEAESRTSATVDVRLSEDKEESGVSTTCPERIVQRPRR